MQAHIKERTDREIVQALNKVRSQTATKVIKRVKAGDDLTTQGIMALGLDDATADRTVLTRLIKAGLTTVLFGFLQKCTSQTFQQTLPKGGNLTHPCVWLAILVNIVADGSLSTPTMVQEQREFVVKNLDPVIDCMHEEMFYQSHQNWVFTLEAFSGLLQNLCNGSPSIAEVLLKKEKIIHFVVQSMCFDVYRPDIAATLPHSGFTIEVRACAAKVLQHLCQADDSKNSYYCFSDKDLAHLHQVSQVPAIHPKKVDSKTTGSNRTLANSLTRSIALENSETTQESLLYVLQQLQHGINHELFGTDHIIDLMAVADTISTPAVASRYVRAVHDSLGLPDLEKRNSNSKPPPSDKKCADAIQHGLFDTLLQFQAKFGVSQPDLLEESKNILDMVGLLLFFVKTNKVLKKDMTKFRESIATYLSDPEAKSLAEMMVVLLNKIDDTKKNWSPTNQKREGCGWCNAGIASEKVFVCGACRCVIYCSKECQRNDWKKGGHKANCKKLMHLAEAKAKNAISGEDDSKFTKYLTNACNQTFTKNRGQIYLQASLRGLRMSECIVKFDYTVTPTRMITQTFADFLQDLKDSGASKESLQAFKRALESNKANGRVSAVCVGTSIDLSDGNMLLVTIQLDADHTLDEGQRMHFDQKMSAPWMAEIVANPIRKKDLIEMSTLANE